MKPSKEYLGILALRKKPRPDLLSAGDVWLVQCGGLANVMLVMGHTRKTRYGVGHTFVWLYHDGRPCLRAAPHDLRDDDGNSYPAESMIKGRGAKYLGNVFAMFPQDVFRFLGDH